MSFWDKGLANLAAYRSVCEDLTARRTPIQLVGLAHVHKVLFAASLTAKLKKRAVMLAGDEAEANRLTEDLKALGLRVLYLPYLNIPAGAGRSDEVYFNNVFSDIYGENGNGTINLESENIIGRDPDKLGMSDDITLKAIYDKGEDSDVEQHYDINKNIGYCINFNGNIDQMNFDSNDNFEFNCVLIYYRIRKGGGEWCTNLYGVLFLEEIKEISDGDNGVIGYIQRYPKFKNGNSWGLKIDLKIDTQPDSQMVMRDIEYTNPNDGSGMQMFSEALIQLDGCVKLFYEVKKENTDIEERLYTLENILSGVDEVNNLSNDVNILRTRVEMFQPSIDSLGERLSSIESRISKLETNLGYLINELKK